MGWVYPSERMRSARPSGRARIETYFSCRMLASSSVAPVLRGGRGLKLINLRKCFRCCKVAPVLRGGRGLKHQRRNKYGNDYR